MNSHFEAEQRTVRRTRAIIHHRYRIRETIITGLILLVVLALGIQLFQAHEERVQLSAQARANRTELVQQHRKARDLRLNLRQLHNTKYVEQLLSQRFSYSRPGETVYNLPGSVAKDVTRR